MTRLLTGISRLQPQLEHVLDGQLGEITSYFTQFMELYSCLHYLRLWKEVKDYKALFATGNDQDGEDDSPIYNGPSTLTRRKIEPLLDTRQHVEASSPVVSRSAIQKSGYTCSPFFF